MACDYSTGRRVAFGRAGSPDADLAVAVAASCAIPGLYHPVTIDGRRYVDGGIYSASNADILRSGDWISSSAQPDLHPPPHSRRSTPRRLQHRVPAGLRAPAR
jgi:predicted acylesterase/phospholipase RssA